MKRGEILRKKQALQELEEIKLDPSKSEDIEMISSSAGQSIEELK